MAKPINLDIFNSATPSNAMPGEAPAPVTPPAQEPAKAAEPAKQQEQPDVKLKPGEKAGQLHDPAENKSRLSDGFKERMAALAAEDSDGDPDGAHPEDPNDRSPDGESEGGGQQNPDQAPEQKMSNFKIVKLKLKAAEDELAALKASGSTGTDELETYKEKVTRLEAERAEHQKVIKETEDFKLKAKIVSEDDFQRDIKIPRDNIAKSIKAELSREGIGEGLWEEAQKVGTKQELEALVKENVQSEILRTQFYNAFFADVELREKEIAAMQAPEEYLRKVQQDSADAKVAKKIELEDTFKSVWGNARSNADKVARNLGDNKIIELMEIAGNDAHNNNTVKPLIEAADNAAQAMLQERVELGLPIDEEVATRTVYLWRQAIAAQAINKQRLEWFNKYSGSQNELKTLQEKYDKLLTKGNPSSHASSGNGSSKSTEEYIPGDLKGNIAKLAQQM